MLFWADWVEQRGIQKLVLLRSCTVAADIGATAQYFGICIDLKAEVWDLNLPQSAQDSRFIGLKTAISPSERVDVFSEQCLCVGTQMSEYWQSDQQVL